MNDLKKGVSNNLSLLPKELINHVNKTLNPKISSLNDAINSNAEKKFVDQITKSIWFDKNILELQNEEYYKKYYFPAFENILKSKEFVKFSEATFFVRVNVPGIEDYYSKWHQDVGTFLYSSKNNVYRYNSYTLWCSLTESSTDNSIEFVDKKYYDNKIYNSYFKKSIRHGHITFDKSKIPFDENNIKTIKFNFKPGEAVIFDSLIFHRTVRKAKQIRVSFDLRVSKKNSGSFIKKISFIPSFKRFVFEKTGFKFF